MIKEELFNQITQSLSPFAPIDPWTTCFASFDPLKRIYLEKNVF